MAISLNPNRQKTEIQSILENNDIQTIIKNYIKEDKEDELQTSHVMNLLYPEEDNEETRHTEYNKWLGQTATLNFGLQTETKMTHEQMLLILIKEGILEVPKIPMRYPEYTPKEWGSGMLLPLENDLGRPILQQDTGYRPVMVIDYVKVS